MNEVSPQSGEYVRMLEYLRKCRTSISALYLGLARSFARREPEKVPERPDCRISIYWGCAVFALFIGGFFVWAITAPLSSGAIASGVVRVESNRKTIQHLEGGIVEEILVREGDNVQVGQLLMRLDRTQAQATWELYTGLQNTIVADEARLTAEQDERGQITFPEMLESRRSKDPRIKEILDGQEEIFRTRKTSINGQYSILNKRIGQLKVQIRGLREQTMATETQLSLIREEVTGVQFLLEKGLVQKTRLLALQRQTARLEGQLGEYAASIARTEEMIGETRLQIGNIKNSVNKEIAEQLRGARDRLAEVEKRLKAAEDVLVRRDVLATESGIVVALRIFTVGGVVAPGSAILDIVPQNETLVIETRIKPTDIDIVRVGMVVQVRLTVYKQRTTPTIQGYLRYVSPDVLTDAATGRSYFEGRVEVPAEELERLEDVALYPGMPVEVMIVSGERTFLDYLLAPLRESFARSFFEA